jgi:hypothetical protein
MYKQALRSHGLLPMREYFVQDRLTEAGSKLQYRILLAGAVDLPVASF